MPLHIPLIFHLDQPLSEKSLTASRTAYRGLLRVLRSHPTLPVNIQISGTLIDALKWLDPEPLQLIWEGLRAGQFELLGSTYAQNVPYASDDWDNARQIDLHQEVLHETFGVTPVTFWNPGGCWRQSLLPVISGAGYRFTLVEDYVLAQARLAEPVVVTSQVGAHILTLVYDDQQLKHLFNFAVWFGRPGQLQTYLMRRAEQPNAFNHCLAYAEDGEALGMWGWHEGVVPNQTWHRLDQVLSLLEALPEIQLIHLTNAPPSAGNLSPIPDGSATWMDFALEEPEHPEYEEGFEDWFDFNERSPKLARYREFFAEIREAWQTLDSELDEQKAKKNAPARKFLQEALDNYLSHQYRFGRVGAGGEGYRGWDGAVASWVLMAAARWALNPEPFTLAEDVNHDGHVEWVVSDGEQVIVTTPLGGRLLYWFDLLTGEQFIGNQRAVTPTTYEADAALPEIKTYPNALWLPEDYRPQAIVPEARLTAESAPTRMGKYLPAWVWEGEREPFELLTREMHLPGATELRPGQRRALVDYVVVADEEGSPVEVEQEAGAELEVESTDGSVTFTRQLCSGLTLSKEILLEEDAIVTRYQWRNEGEQTFVLTWRVVNELCPAYQALIEKERDAVDFEKDEERPGVANSAARVGVFVQADPQPLGFEYNEAMLALELNPVFELTLPPGGEESFTVWLQRQEVQKRKKRRR
jgi:hypothetical protein